MKCQFPVLFGGCARPNSSKTYDSLKRLTSATNPESGTISYLYDNNGNLTQKTDPRTTSGLNWTTNYTYDALNRPILKSYTNDGGVTPPVDYYYDSASLPSGAPASFNRGYSTGRLVATETYPVVPGASDRRTVSYSLDAAARLSALSSPATTYAAAASVGSISYKPHGGLESETLGNSLIHQMSYNTRLQPTAIKLGTSGSPTSVLNLTYDYGTTDNNGNVKSILNIVGLITLTQTYTYDSVNRVSTATETSTAGGGWTETEGYDRYDNRWIDLGGGVQSQYISTTNNRITGKTYDAAGNLTVDGTTS
jgi:YD repeat-containing protein